MLIQDLHLTDIQALELAYATTCQALNTAKTVIEELQDEIATLKEKLRLAQSNAFGKSSEQSLPPSPEESKPGKTTTVSGYTRKANNKPRGKTTDLSHYPMRAKKKRRQTIAKPILKSIQSWLSQVAPQVPPKSKLGQAIAYTLKQWPYLTQYLKHGWAQIDTNWVENQIRPIAIGKKNFLFMGHEDSATIHALFYSLVSSAILNKINPRLYLNYLLTQIHPLRQKKIDPFLLLPHLIDKAKLHDFAKQQLQLAKSVLNAIA